MCRIQGLRRISDSEYEVEAVGALGLKAVQVFRFRLECRRTNSFSYTSMLGDI